MTDKLKLKVGEALPGFRFKPGCLERMTSWLVVYHITIFLHTRFLHVFFLDLVTTVILCAFTERARLLRMAPANPFRKLERQCCHAAKSKAHNETQARG
jgi:hypothetical protein